MILSEKSATFRDHALSHCALMRIRLARLPQKAARPTDGIPHRGFAWSLTLRKIPPCFLCDAVAYFRSAVACSRALPPPSLGVSSQTWAAGSALAALFCDVREKALAFGARAGTGLAEYSPHTAIHTAAMQQKHKSIDAAFRIIGATITIVLVASPRFSGLSRSDLDRMSLSTWRRLALDVMTRVARTGRAEPHTSGTSHGAS
jgi:hypothetical protein